MKKSAAAEERRGKKRKQSGGKGGRGNRSLSSRPSAVDDVSQEAVRNDNNLPHAPKQLSLPPVSLQESRSSTPHSLLDEASQSRHDQQEPPHDLQSQQGGLDEGFRPKDVLVGTGTQSVSNEGTMRYRKLIDQGRVEYSKAGMSRAGKTRKRAISEAILEVLLTNEDRRFYRKIGNSVVHLTEQSVRLNTVQHALRHPRPGSQQPQDQENDCIACKYLFAPDTISETSRAGMMCDLCAIECTKDLEEGVKVKQRLEAYKRSHTSTLANNQGNASNHEGSDDDDDFDRSTPTHCIACQYFKGPDTLAVETTRLGLLCISCVRLCDEQLEYTEGVIETLQDFLRSHACTLAKKQGDSGCPCCSPSGPRNDVAVPAFTRSTRLCGPTPMRKSNKGPIKHGNDCVTRCLEKINAIKEWPESQAAQAEIAEDLSLWKSHTAVRQRAAEAQRARRESEPDTAPTPAKKAFHQANRRQARQDVRDPIREAKRSSDLPRTIKLTERAYGNRLLLEVRADLLAEGHLASFFALDPVAILASYPELLISMVTDGHMNLGMSSAVTAMTGESASVVVINQEHLYEMNNILLGFDVKDRVRPKKKPVGVFQITFRYATVQDIGLGEGDPKSKSIRIYTQVDLDDTSRIEEIMKASAEVVQCRNVVRTALKAAKIECSPNAPCYYEQAKHVQFPLDLITNDDVKRVLMEAKAGVHGRGAQAALHLGSITTKFISCTSAWWLRVPLELGFGSSHSFFPFNATKWNELMAHVEDEKSFHCRMLLAWAGFDGSILPGYFGVILPFEKSKADREAIQEAGRDNGTVVGLFLGIFSDLFDIEPNIYCHTYMSKDLVYLFVTRKKLLWSIAGVLFPYANGYLSQKRMANLTDYLEYWPLSRGEREFSPEEIEQRQQQAYEEYVERHSEDGSAEIDEIRQEFEDNDEQELDEDNSAGHASAPSGVGEVCIFRDDQRGVAVYITSGPDPTVRLSGNPLTITNTSNPLASEIEVRHANLHSLLTPGTYVDSEIISGYLELVVHRFHGSLDVCSAHTHTIMTLESEEWSDANSFLTQSSFVPEGWERKKLILVPVFTSSSTDSIKGETSGHWSNVIFDRTDDSRPNCVNCVYADSLPRDWRFEGLKSLFAGTHLVGNSGRWMNAINPFQTPGGNDCGAWTCLKSAVYCAAVANNTLHNGSSSGTEPVCHFWLDEDTDVATWEALARRHILDSLCRQSIDFSATPLTQLHVKVVRSTTEIPAAVSYKSKRSKPSKAQPRSTRNSEPEYEVFDVTIEEPERLGVTIHRRNMPSNLTAMIPNIRHSDSGDVMITECPTNSAGERAGLKSGDWLLLPRSSGGTLTVVTDFDEIRQYAKRKERPLTFQVVRRVSSGRSDKSDSYDDSSVTDQ